MCFMQMIMKDMKIMTFDEAIKYVKENSFIPSYEDVYKYNSVTDLDDVIDILEKLREEYAPTVEMTKEQYEQFVEFRKKTDFVQSHAVTLIKRNTKYPKFLNDSIGGICGKEFLQVWSHPETIKVVDE